jgi:hypothetical protein
LSSQANPLANAIRAVGSLNQQRAAALSGSLHAPAPAQRALGLAFSAGDRVLDLVTGQQGVITDATAEHLIAQPAESPAS